MVGRTDVFSVEGNIQRAAPNMTFWVLVDNGPETMIGREILTRLNGPMRMNRIKVMPGDRVKVEVSTYDLTKGRIVYRM